MLALSLSLSMLSSIYMLPYVYGLCASREAVNYRGKAVRNSLGIFFVLDILIICTAILVYNGFFYSSASVMADISSIIIGSICSAFAGVVDDTTDDPVKGISGHIKMFMNGTLTAGLLKAFMGVISCFLVCLILDYRGYSLIIGTMVLSLSINFINLMDVRPLRAIKAYTVFSLILFPFAGFIYDCVSLGILSSLPFYMRYESRELCMMGDTGSNALGILLGLSIISCRNPYFDISALVLLCIVQIYGEKKSVSKLIESSSILKYIDMAGRSGEFDKDKEGRRTGDNSKR